MPSEQSRKKAQAAKEYIENMYKLQQQSIQERLERCARPPQLVTHLSAWNIHPNLRGVSASAETLQGWTEGTWREGQRPPCAQEESAGEAAAERAHV